MRVQGFKILEEPTNGDRVKALRRIQARREFVKVWGLALGMVPFLYYAQQWLASNFTIALAITAAGALCVWNIISLAVDTYMPNGLLWKSGDCIGLVGAGSKGIEARAAQALWQYTQAHFNEPHEVAAFRVSPERWHEVARVASVPVRRLRDLSR